MNTEFIKGVIVPILTIIDGEERIDEAAMRDVYKRQRLLSG